MSGEAQKTLLRLKEKGQKVPLLDSKPELFADVADVWEGFGVLHSTRSAWYTPNPIAMSDINALVTLFEVTGDRREEWVYLIRSLDRKWLELYRKQQAEEEEQKSADSSGSDRRPQRNRRRP